MFWLLTLLFLMAFGHMVNKHFGRPPEPLPPPPTMDVDDIQYSSAFDIVKDLSEEENNFQNPQVIESEKLMDTLDAVSFYGGPETFPIPA